MERNVHYFLLPLSISNSLVQRGTSSSRSETDWTGETALEGDTEQRAGEHHTFRLLRLFPPLWPTQ